MWVGTEFRGDTNKTLKMIQFGMYGRMLVRLYNWPRDRYLDASRLVRLETELTERLRSMKEFDHRTLQDFHDLIAAWFRFSWSEGGQLRLGETDEDYRRRAAEEWETFFEKEVQELTADDEFTRAIVVAAAYGNSEKGVAAEGQLREMLKERYRSMRRPEE